MDTQINKFGFEIEGEYGDEAYEELASSDWGRMVNDSSLSECTDVNCEQRLSCREFVSVPFSPNELEDEVKDLFETLQEYYTNDNGPRDFHYNDSAGFHIHLSFEPKKPEEVFSTAFYEHFKKEIVDEFPCAWNYRKDSRYCRPNDDNGYSDSELYRMSGKDNGVRYRAINFSAFQEHETIEFRIFPSNEPDVLFEYLKFTIETTNRFLDKDVVEVEEELDMNLNKDKGSREYKREVHLPNKAELNYEGGVRT